MSKLKFLKVSATVEDLEEFILGERKRRSSLEESILEAPPGWHPLIRELHKKLIEMGWAGEIQQIKEKFGGLRFYVSGATDEQYQLIADYEDKTFDICETCGQPGELRKTSWRRTLCDEHSS